MSKEPVPQPIQALVGLVPYRDPEAWKEKKRLEREQNQAEREAHAEREAIQWESRQAEKVWTNDGKKHLAAANATGDRCGNARSRSSGTDREGSGQVCLRSTTVVGSWTKLAELDVALGGPQVLPPPAGEASESPKQARSERWYVDPQCELCSQLAEIEVESAFGRELPQPAAAGWYRLGRDVYRIGEGPFPGFGTGTTPIKRYGPMVQRSLF
jgi:hypothetical protein